METFVELRSLVRTVRGDDGWATISDAFRNDDEVHVTGFSPSGVGTVVPVRGAIFGEERSLTPERAVVGRSLSVWADVSALPRAGLEHIVTTVRAAIDDVFARWGGTQAFLTRWGLAPSGFVTAYERAVGRKGFSTKESAARWLRAVGNDSNWLAPSLLAHVSIERLEKLARVEVRASGARITLFDPDAYGELEDALAEVLPGPET